MYWNLKKVKNPNLECTIPKVLDPLIKFFIMDMTVGWKKFIGKVWPGIKMIPGRAKIGKSWIRSSSKIVRPAISCPSPKYWCWVGNCVSNVSPSASSSSSLEESGGSVEVTLSLVLWSLACTIANLTSSQLGWSTKVSLKIVYFWQSRNSFTLKIWHWKKVF